MRIQVLAAATLLAASFGLHAATDDPFVVHEWGTFTTVHGANGEQIWWQPPASVDLPDFVYLPDFQYRADAGGKAPAKLLAFPKDRVALARMETPVIYFYSQRERVADVRVMFRGGFLTEWYPQATNLESRIGESGATEAHQWRFQIEWNGVQVLARDTREMTLDRLIRNEAGDGDHYYIARETDANFLRVSSPLARKRPEYERDLFYRGLGYFQAPLGVAMDADERRVLLNTHEAEQFATAFVLTIRQGMMRYQKRVGPITRATSTIGLESQPFGALRDVRELAMREMAAALVEQGLYEKEALAMVSTWQDQWFAEEGTRVLYLLPRAWTDRTLELKVSPQPDQVVRVMVGRAELITPTTERDIRQQILSFKSGDARAKSRAVAETRALGLGRFLYAAVARATAAGTDEATTKAAWELFAAASAREGERSARN
jgi:hypothetical protein